MDGNVHSAMRHPVGIGARSCRNIPHAESGDGRRFRGMIGGRLASPEQDTSRFAGSDRGPAPPSKSPTLTMDGIPGRHAGPSAPDIIEKLPRTSCGCATF